jgi:hypothetical protein
MAPLRKVHTSVSEKFSASWRTEGMSRSGNLLTMLFFLFAGMVYFLLGESFFRNSPGR